MSSPPVACVLVNQTSDPVRFAQGWVSGSINNPSWFNSFLPGAQGAATANGNILCVNALAPDGKPVQQCVNVAITPSYTSLGSVACTSLDGGVFVCSAGSSDADAIQSCTTNASRGP